ncbi:MAG: Mth938-like domain-containing protein [Gammaproteobacteria bacterium]|nr:Mth938-like domain-containing protein [Gammaproteobacteria bacterium]MBA3732452.1 Mth938-like domain-containing protein [Gammaproteobacteria bacterium]
MDITQEFGPGNYRIRAYEAGRVVINERAFTDSLIVTPDRLEPHWPPRTLAALEPTNLELIMALQPEVVLLGTGPRLRFPAPEVMDFFRRKRIGFETMDTAAACRTFNVLMAEGRAVAAALLMA